MKRKNKPSQMDKDKIQFSTIIVYNNKMAVITITITIIIIINLNILCVYIFLYYVQTVYKLKDYEEKKQTPNS